MKDRLKSFPELRIFCQNVNRNYGYMDTLLASLYNQYDLLFIQEPPWRCIRSAPSSASCEGEDVIGPPISPNWGVIHRPSGYRFLTCHRHLLPWESPPAALLDA
jgi:hypothetical protein